MASHTPPPGDVIETDFQIYELMSEVLELADVRSLSPSPLPVDCSSSVYSQSTQDSPDSQSMDHRDKWEERDDMSVDAYQPVTRLSQASEESKLSKASSEHLTNPSSWTSEGLPELYARGEFTGDYSTSPASSSPNSPRPAPRRNSLRNLKNLLLSTNGVGNVCLISPKAGPYEGRLIAVMCPSSIQPDDTTDITPISLSKDVNEWKTIINAIKSSLFGQSDDFRSPDLWIILRHIATDENNKPLRRRLQTWAQNLTPEDQVQIDALQKIFTSPFLSKNIPSTPFSRMSPIELGNNEVAASRNLPRRIEYNVPGVADEACEEVFYPLSTMQQLYFRMSVTREFAPSIFSEREYRFSQSIALQVKCGVDMTDIEAAIDALVARHSMLRARFRLTGDGWSQKIVPHAPTAYHFGHQYVNSDDDIAAIVNKAQASIDALNGPTFAAEHIRTTDNVQLLYLVAHHLVVDVESWKIILRDLDELLQSGQARSEPSISFPIWVDKQCRDKTNGPAFPFQVSPINLEYWGLKGTPNCYGDTESTSFSLSPDKMLAVSSASERAFRASPVDVFLAALLLSFSQAFPDRCVPTAWKQEVGRDVGRHDPQVDDVVGWFTSLQPFNVPTFTMPDFADLVKMMKDVRVTKPQNVAPSFNSRYSTLQSPLTPVPVELMFNYVDSLPNLSSGHGILEPVLTAGHGMKSLSSYLGPSVGRIALFEISVVVEDDGATVQALSHRESKHRDKIETWMKNFERVVVGAAELLETLEPQLTPSDVPLLKVSYEGMSKLTAHRLVEMGIRGVENIETICPVSPIQQELIIAQSQSSERLHAAAVFELTASPLPLNVPIDRKRLIYSWETIVASQPALRSIFMDSISEEGLFDQIIFKEIVPTIVFLEGVHSLESFIQHAPMEMSRSWPQHQISVCATPTGTLLKLESSGAICDATSIQSLVAQLGMIYSGETIPTNPAMLPDHPQHVSSLDASHSLRTWSSILCDARPCIFPSLINDTSKRTQSMFFDLGVTRNEMLRFCSANKFQLPSLVQLAWGLVLHIFVGTKQIAFGFQLPGSEQKRLANVHHTAGCFSSMLPCILNLDQDRTPMACLEALKQLSDKSSHCQVPTMSELQHNLGLNNEHLFNTCASFQDPEASPGSARSEFNTSLVAMSELTGFDLSLTTTIIAGRLHASLGFKSIAPAHAKSIINSFENAIRLIMEFTHSPVSDLQFVADHEHTQDELRDSFPPADTEALSAFFVHDLVLRHAQSRREASAICASDGELSYGQVEKLVTNLSSYLINLGVRPGMPVPIVLEKCRWSAVIMLAVLNAGGCLICLDAQDPVTVETTINQLDPVVVVSTDAAWELVGRVSRSCVLVNETFLETLPTQVSSVCAELEPDHAACMFVMPSGGGRGKPKGIYFTHSSLSRAFLLQGPALGISEKSRVMQLSAFNVDIALVEILCTLVQGGCICVPTAKERKHNLERAISRMKVTWTYMTTVLAHRLDPTAVPSVKTICFRTRTLDAEVCAPWMEGREIVLAYGAPDVCPLAISVTKLKSLDMLDLISPPLMGRFRVVNPENHHCLMPPGAIGELTIDSSLLTPHSYVPGKPAYSAHFSDSSRKNVSCSRTGHRVRCLEDGNVQFLCTINDRTDIQGLPVSVSDVEKRLQQCLGREARVVVQKVTSSDSVASLVAFLEPRFTANSRSSTLQALWTKDTESIAQRIMDAATSSARGRYKELPSHAFPPLFVPLKAFPLSTSLKVNRRKLEKMAMAMSFNQLLEASTIPLPMNDAQRALRQKPLPLTKTEELVRGIWARVLNVPPMDINADTSYLEAGGNRHLAAKLVVACRQTGLDISIEQVLDGTTLTDLCRSLDRLAGQRRKRRQGDSRHGPNSPNKSLELLDNRFIKELVASQLKVTTSDIQEVQEATAQQIRSLELGMYKPKGGMNHVVVSLDGKIDSDKLRETCMILSKARPMLRTAFAIHNCRVYRASVSSFKPDFQRHQCPVWRLSSVADYVMAQDLNLAFRVDEPTTKFTLLDAESKGILIMRVSAAQVHEAAVPTLIQDLMTLYEHPTKVPRACALSCMTGPRSSGYEETVKYWKKELDGWDMTMIVGHSKPYPPVKDVTSIKKSVDIDTVKNAPFDVILKAAWAVTLATISGESNVLFGEVVSGNGSSLFSYGSDSLSGDEPKTSIVPMPVRFTAEPTTPQDFIQYIKSLGQSGSSRQSLSTLDLVRKCTKWAYWTRFSSVVQHRPAPASSPPGKQPTTLDTEDLSYSFSVVESSAKDTPDLFISSTTSPGKAELSIEYSPSRVPPRIAQRTLNILAGAVQMMCCQSTVADPIIAPRTAAPPKPLIPIASPPAPDDKLVIRNWLSDEDRASLQSIVASAWTETLPARCLGGIPDDKASTARFYDLWGCLLPASLMAAHLNHSLPQAKIPGLEMIQISAEDVINFSSRTMLLELLARKMRDSALISEPTKRRRTIKLPGTGGIGPGANPPGAGAAGSVVGGGGTGSGTEQPETSPSSTSPSKWKSPLGLSPSRLSSAFYKRGTFVGKK